MVSVSDFRNWVKLHPNFMTPHILGVRQSGNFFIELSEGTGISDEPIFGVSVLEWKDGEFHSVLRVN